MGIKFNTNQSFYTVDEVLSRFTAGPDTGVFTDGSSIPNPGPGGWGFVHVEKGEILHSGYGSDPDTTNNRMELTALINAYTYLPLDTRIEIFTDSNLCVMTINQWAKSWEQRGWKRKDGPIANLELVQTLYEEHRKRPGVTLKWIKAHNGWKWNEYADSLSTAWMREKP